ncbi:hypothetical protein [Acinetobacter higginsii]|uniref:phage tail tube protein n=1 Tax=Acinetobacter higginsii TaxID=70347 RepID=UPI0026775270|nr:hypothetical protein [Acinetobacter higginsii]MDO3665337.1 hypothetical protein [Acinetobacter higginsii]
MATEYISLQGKFHLAPIVNEVVGALRYLGNMPEFEVGITADVIEHQESTTGKRTTDFTMVQTTGVTFSGTIEEASKENIKYILSGENFEIPSATVTGKSLGTVVADQVILLDAYNLTAVVVKDSTGTPVEVPPTKYVLDPVFGTIKFTDVAGLTMPLKIDYTSGAVTQTTIASDLEQEYLLYFEGVNTANGNKVAMKLWRTKKSPEVTFPLIHEELGQYQIQGQALSDISKANDSKLGLYGHFVNIPASP